MIRKLALMIINIPKFMHFVYTVPWSSEVVSKSTVTIPECESKKLKMMKSFT